MIRNNLPYKLLALAVALALWAYVNSERNPQARRQFSVPVEVRNLAKGFAADPSAKDANVTVQGLKSTVDSISRDRISAWVDLKGAAPSTGTVETKAKLNVRVLDVPTGDVDVAFQPKNVTVRVEALGRRQLPVEVKFLSSPPLGYSYGEPQLSPASVGLSGKISQVLQVKRVTLPISNEGADRTIEGYFPVVPVDSKGNVVNGVELDTDRVRLRLELVEVPATKTVIVSANVVGQPRFPAKVTRIMISPSSVTLEGKPRALMGISTVGTDDIAIDEAEGTVVRQVGLRVPTGADIVGSKKVRVTIFIGNKEQPSVPNGD